MDVGGYSGVGGDEIIIWLALKRLIASLLNLNWINVYWNESWFYGWWWIEFRKISISYFRNSAFEIVWTPVSSFRSPIIVFYISEWKVFLIQPLLHLEANIVKLTPSILVHCQSFHYGLLITDDVCPNRLECSPRLCALHWLSIWSWGIPDNKPF